MNPRLLLGAMALFLFCAASRAAERTNTLELLSARKIWDKGKHNAFTDLIRFGGQWLCVFREGDAHVGGNGGIRVHSSADGEEWTPAAFITEPGVDLRDPKLSITPDGRLMLALGGSLYEGTTLKGYQPRISFSTDGRKWTAPQKTLGNRDWLWRVTWHKGRAYGIVYSTPEKGGEWTARLVESADGVNYDLTTPLEVPGRPNEGTLRFLESGDAVALLRREGPKNTDLDAWIGLSRSPYREWKWTSAGMQIGGPNFIAAEGGGFLASGRQYNPAPAGPKTFVGSMTLSSVTPQLILPSGGDTSYAGMVLENGILWVSYYSSHEGRSGIYIAKIKVTR